MNIKNRSSFRADFQLMRDNCYLYNKDKPLNAGLLPISDTLLKIADEELLKRDSALKEIEDKIKQPEN